MANHTKLSLDSDFGFDFDKHHNLYLMYDEKNNTIVLLLYYISSTINTNLKKLVLLAADQDHYSMILANIQKCPP